MDTNHALSAFAALAQATRLDVFRLLITAGPKGMAAGEISDALNVRQNTMSSHLSILLNAGLICNTRDGRRITYFVDFDGMQGLLVFLLEDCCGGQPEYCQPVIAQIACAYVAKGNAQ